MIDHDTEKSPLIGQSRSNAGLGVNRRKGKAMNFKKWEKWVSEIDALTGGATVELKTFHKGGMVIGVRWMRGKEQFSYEHAMSLGEIDRMYEVIQPNVLESITNAVRRMMANEQ